MDSGKYPVGYIHQQALTDGDGQKIQYRRELAFAVKYERDQLFGQLIQGKKQKSMMVDMITLPKEVVKFINSSGG